MDLPENLKFRQLSEAVRQATWVLSTAEHSASGHPLGIPRRGGTDGGERAQGPGAWRVIPLGVWSPGWEGTKTPERR